MNYTLNCNGKLLFIDRPLVMGILNATPDSFYTKGRSSDMEGLSLQAAKMLEDGATILDVGGVSTRPKAPEVSEKEELERVIPVIEILKKNHPEAFISVDTYRANVATAAVEAGASLINDISGGTMDSKMFQTIGRLNVSYILMHIQGTPQTMQDKPQYEDVVREVLDFFIKKIAEANEAGIKDIVIDPGFGFGKTLAHNFELLRNLEAFQILEKPLLMGVSRKSMVYKLLGGNAETALNGTTVMHTIGLQKKAAILRVHDVKEAMECITISETLKSGL